MSHTKVYGICENKCKVEVIPKENLVLMSVASMKLNYTGKATWKLSSGGLSSAHKYIPLGFTAKNTSTGNNESYGVESMTVNATAGEFTVKFSDEAKNINFTDILIAFLRID